MRKAKISLLKFLYALIIGLFVSAFSFGASTVMAAEPQAKEAVAEEAAPAGENADSANDGSSGMFLLFGGMLLIIIAVVVTVSASVVSVAAVADEV